MYLLMPLAFPIRLQTSTQKVALLAALTLVHLACSSEPERGGPAGAGGTTSGGAGMAGVVPGSAGSSAGGPAAGGPGGSAGTTGSAGSPGAGAPSGGGGGAGGTGPTGGAGGGSAGGGAVDSCSGVTSKFCDDFEKQTAGQPPKGDLSLDADSGAIVVDATKAFSGTQAVHIETAKPGSQSFMRFTKQFPMNDFHGRAMFFVTAIPKAEIHWDLIDSQSQNGFHWEIGGMYGKYILVVDPPDHGLTSNTFPTGKWFCLQWQFKFGGAGNDNTFVAKMDGTALQNGEFTGADSDGEKWSAGPWSNLNIGWTGYGGSDVDIELWIDDLAFGDMPIACPASK